MSKFDKIVEDLQDALNTAKLKLEKIKTDGHQASALLDDVNTLLDSSYLKTEEDYEIYNTSEDYYSSSNC